MKNILTILFLLLLPVCIAAQADILLVNGKVFTADEKGTIAEAVAIKGERIVAVGTTKEIRAKFPRAKAIDLKGKLVTPGFNDAHVHFLRGALAMLTVNLQDSKSVDEAVGRVAEKVKSVKPGEWIIGRGWDHTLWGGKFPSAKDLDVVAPNNPVFLVRVDGHVAWINSKAIEMAGIRNSKAPDGGEIERDADGNPTGILKETAQGLVSRMIPPPSQEMNFRGLEMALDMARRLGVTSIQDNSGYETTKVYREFLNAGKLTVRISEWQNFEDSVETLKKQRAEFAAFKDDPNRLKLTALKGVVDGTLGSRTAAMLAPYSDDPQNSGLPRRSQEELTKMIVERDQAGFQITLHAIGDKANRMVLEGFVEATNRKSPNPANKNSDTPPAENLFVVFKGRSLKIKWGEWRYTNPKRHRIEHAQVISPSDFNLFQELGIIASMQPTHLITDQRWAGDRLGEYRSLGAYSWHTMRSYGVRIPFGTDFPVEPLNPYLGLYSAVTRKQLNGQPESGWNPQERVSMAEAIRCYTVESAYAEFSEKEKGQIKAGMLADLVVHSKDLLTIEPKEIPTTEPVMTIFNGKIIYEKK